jgi:predicted ATPase
VKFTIHEWRKGYVPASKSRAFLVTNNWDDFGYTTMFTLVVFTSTGERHTIGKVKIGQKDNATEDWQSTVSQPFKELNDSCFSLGQDDGYYLNLQRLGAELRKDLLAQLRDVAANAELFEEVKAEDMMTSSLLRWVTPTTVRGQFRRLAHGGVRLTHYSFEYKLARRGGATIPPPPSLTFDVVPDSNPPTNIHVLIGRNGVGKTQLLHQMTTALVADNLPSAKQGSFQPDTDEESGEKMFANLVSVTFSAFDPFIQLSELSEKDRKINYAYIGLKRESNTGAGFGTPKSAAMLENEFAKSVAACLGNARQARWLRAVRTLEADPIFRDANVPGLLEEDAEYTESSQLNDEQGEKRFRRRAAALYRPLSSGHKLVLMTVTQLVEAVEERTLVLLDEPEAHLHPPLLAAFIRALSDLLVDRNGVAIMATHSPVVLQEVPLTCAWKLRRAGNSMIAERPSIETFGENVGVLTREVFGLEVTEAGYHQLLRQAVAEADSYEDVLSAFDQALGMEARALVRALLLARTNR